MRRLPVLLVLNFAAFVSLGLPDGLLGVAWPSIRRTFDLPLDALAGLLVPFTASYVLASFSSGAILARMTVGALLAASCLATGVSLLGYALAPLWGVMVVCAALSGLGAGAIDAGVNAYVASHHDARTLNWMHAAYGVGAASGPLIMTGVMTSGRGWQFGYGLVAAGQLVLAALFGASRAWWPAPERSPASASGAAHAPLLRTLRVPRVWMGIAAFFIYTGLEAVAGVWAYSFLTSVRGLSMARAGAGVTLYWASLTAGRMIFGAIVGRRPLASMLRGSLALLVFAAGLVWSSSSALVSVFGFALLGLAAGPVFPSLMAGTPARLGEPHVRNGVGFQVAAAALGQSLLPALVGVLARGLGLAVIGPVLVVAALSLVALHEALAAPRYALVGRDPSSSRCILPG
jgi:fucose permease